jgi:transcriptional regulator with XRE-family HTH domain
MPPTIAIGYNPSRRKKSPRVFDRAGPASHHAPMKRLAALRKAQGLTQADLAARAGIAQPYLSTLERGNTSATLRTVYDLATALGVGPADLFEPSEAHAALLNLYDSLPEVHRETALRILETYAASVLAPPR